MGKFGAAIIYLIEKYGLSLGAAKRYLLRNTLASATAAKRKGFNIAPPGERARHLAEVHGTSPPPAPRAKLTELEREFWEQVKKG